MQQTPTQRAILRQWEIRREEQKCLDFLDTPCYRKDMHPLTIKRVPYSKARPIIRVGDIIVCRGGRIVSRAIRTFGGGIYDGSHASIVCADTEIGATGRVVVFEMLGSGPDENYLSQVYAKDHGQLLWFPMNCRPAIQESIIQEAARIQIHGLKYDYKTTWWAALKPMLYDVERALNCSEAVWHLLVMSGRLRHRVDGKGRKLAPVPGDLPAWADVSAAYELDMQA